MSHSRFRGNDTRRRSYRLSITACQPWEQLAGGTAARYALGMPVRTQICEAAIHPSALLAEVSRPENGAVNLFLGVTRNHHDQREVKDLDYHCYRPMAEQELQRVAESVCARHGIREFVALHRIGRVTIGELSLVVAVGAPHRAAALDCTRDFVDALKRDVPIWKRESFADGRAGWVEGVEIVE